MKIFGSITYLLIDYIGHTKLDKKNEKCIFVRYNNESKGYRLYNPESKKIIIFRDVIFDENSFWKWKEEKSHDMQFLEDRST